MRIAGERGFDLKGSGAAPLAPDDPPQIGPFPLVGVLGSGGMGRVYLGAAPGRYTAVKQVLPALADDQDFLRHFGHELDNVAKLPAGVSAQLLATDRTARPPWFATEYIPGLTLSDAVELHGGSLPSSALWLLLRETASCLRAVHARETVHRDLKPSNVMLTRDGITLIDFGIARAVDQSRVTKTGMVVGTPAYMAPEQATGVPQLTAAADVFSLGCLLVYAATGRPPFGGGAGLDLLYRIVHDDADLEAVRNVDAALATVLESCLAKDPAARPTAADLLELAQNHLVHASPAWPQVVTARIREREAFAATAPQRQEASAQLRRSAPPSWRDRSRFCRKPTWRRVPHANVASACCSSSCPSSWWRPERPRPSPLRRTDLRGARRLPHPHPGRHSQADTRTPRRCRPVNRAPWIS
jgi:serine/threonine protein kinase